MKRFTLSVVITAVLGVAAYSLSDAQGGRRGPSGPDMGPAAFQERGGPGGSGRGPGRRGGGAMFGLHGLDLTDEQREEIRAIREAERENRDGPAAEVQLHRQLREALYAEAPDAQKIAALQQQLAQAQAERLAKRIELDQKIAAVLTAEQRAQVRERASAAPRERSAR